MISIETFLKMAVERKAQEILLAPSQPVRLRVGKELVPMNQSSLSITDMRQMVSQLLNDEERKDLFQNLKSCGSRSIGSISFQFDFHVDLDGVTGSLVLQNPNPSQVVAQANSNWNFPQILTESILKPKGLHLFVGPRRSGKTTALRQVLQSIGKKSRAIAFYSGDSTSNLQSPGNLLSQFSIEQFEKNNVPHSSDIVIFDTNNLSICEKALGLSEEGRTVILSLASWNIQMGLQRFLDHCQGDQATRARRLAFTLQSVTGLNLLPGMESGLEGAFEMLLANSEVQAALRDQNYSQISRLMKGLAEKTGMRSLNQSLFQLLIKRKIDLKTAFEFSQEPEELDGLLKKVGI